MNKTIDVLKGRRSVRKYKSEQIKDKELNGILEAGTYAPSGMGLQTSLMVVVQDKDMIDKLARMNAKFASNPDGDPFFGAPTVVIVLGDSEANNYIKDGSLVMGNLMNAAYSLGVDSCWINRAEEVFDTKEGKELLKEWGIDENFRGIGNCILGYGDESPEAKERKDNFIIRV